MVGFESNTTQPLYSETLFWPGGREWLALTNEVANNKEADMSFRYNLSICKSFGVARR